MTRQRHSQTYRAASATTAIAAAALLVACGGAGGGGGSAGAAAPTSSTATFALGSALAALVKDARTTTFNVSGTASKSGQTFAVTGNGTTSESTVLGTFEGAAAYNKTTTVTGSLSAQGVSAPLNSTGTANYDLSFKPLGSISANGYCVTSSYVALPTTAKVGDSGSWFEQTCYSNSAKTTKLVTSTSSFQIEPDTSSTALWRVKTNVSAPTGASISSSTAYRITPSGALSFADSTSSGVVNGVTTSLVFTYP